MLYSGIWTTAAVDAHAQITTIIVMRTDEKILEPITLTVKETKRLTGLGHTTVYKLIGEGRLRTTKVGKRTLIHFNSIKELLGKADEK